MTRDVDLSQLALERSAPSLAPRRPRRAIVSRYFLPGVILIGFLALLTWAVRERLVSAKPVTVVPVIVTRAEVQPAGSPLFQAAGWIEPRPTPILVAAQAEGIIAELLVVEGQAIAAGEPVARLIDVDAKLALQQAEAERALREAEMQSAEAARDAARLTLENPVHLQALLAESQSLLAQTETQRAGIPFLIQSAAARLQFAEQNLQGKKLAQDALSGRLLQQAQSEYDSAAAALKELEGRQPLLEQQAAALRARRDALARQLELLIDENRQVVDAEAQLKAAAARLQQAELAVRAAQLRLERMEVKSPVTGRVLALVARPGSRVMGLDSRGEQSASTVVTLYDPKLLQVRADVRLEDVPLVQPGQPVQIQTASAKEPIQGEVLSATSQANIQKNTLEVKVAIHSPPPTIRPEMLVTTTFLAPPQPAAEVEESQRPERLLVPRQLVESAGEGAQLWVADPSGVARRRSVRLGTAGTTELVEVSEGLMPTDRLISGGREGISDGDRITISGEDASIGIAQTNHS